MREENPPIGLETQVSGVNSGQNQTAKTEHEFSAEELDAAVNLRYEMILQEHDPVDSGSNGIIYRITMDEMSEEARAVLRARGIELDGDAAGKILKVYNKGMAEDEFRYHELAHRLAQEAPFADEEKAAVPRPFEFRTIKLSSETKEKLERRGIKIGGEQVEMILMDFVEGEDLARVMFNWVIEHCPEEKRHILNNVRPGNFDDMHRAAEEILEYERPAGRSRNEAERLSEVRKVNNGNSAKLYRFLKRTGMRMNPAVITQIENTLEYFKQQDMRHHDDHERNFMVSGDYLNPYAKPGTVKVHIVDFGQDRDDLSERVEFSVTEELRKLTEGYEQSRQGEHEQALFDEVESRVNSPGWEEKFKKIVNGQPVEQALRLRLNFARLDRAGLADWVALARYATNNGLATASEVKGLMVELREGMVSRVGRKKTIRISNRSVYDSARVLMELFK